MRSGYRTPKPRAGAQINWGHPLSVGLAGCWLFNEGNGIAFHDVVSGHRATNTTAYDWSRGIPLVGNASFAFTDDGPRIKNFPYSFVVRARPNTFSGTGAVVSMNTPSSNGTTPHIRFSTSTNIRFGLFFDDLDATVPDMTGRMVDTVCLLRANASQEAWEAGRLRNSRTATLGSYTSSNLRIAFGAQSWDSSTGEQTYMEHCFVYNRALSADEIAWLTAEPYAFFHPVSVIRRYQFLIVLPAPSLDGWVQPISQPYIERYDVTSY